MAGKNLIGQDRKLANQRKIVNEKISQGCTVIHILINKLMSIRNATLG